MLKVYDKDHNAIGHIVKYKDLKIEGEVATGDRTLSFTYLAKNHQIEPEYYVQTKEDEYVIKEKTVNSDGFLEYVAVLNLEDLEGKPWSSFSVTDVTIDEAARLALTGTGWTVGECTVTKRRNAGMLQVSSRDVIDKLCIAFMCERVYDTKKKTVSFYPELGEDRGVYFLKGTNLKKLSRKSDSYDYYTRIIPIGANGLTIEAVNGGKNYLENYQYSRKVKSYIWKEESYTDAQALMEDAELKLADLSKPINSYSGEIIDLAAQNEAYSVLSYRLGDTVTLIDAATGIREKQRIMKLTEFEQEPTKNTCELSNTYMTFEELQQKYQEAADIINTMVAGDGRYTGTINVSDILNFEAGLAGSSTAIDLQLGINSLAREMTQVKLAVGQIETNYLQATEANLKYATIESLNVTNQNVHNLTGEYGQFKSMVADEFAAHTGLIDNIQGDLANYKTVVAHDMIAAKGWMLEGSIGDAQISRVSANKLTAGTIDTALVNLVSPDSALQVTGSQILINDTTDPLAQVNRVVLGKYKSAEGMEYGLLVRSKEGNTVMIDGDGVHNAGITDGAIDNNKVADNANISGKKIDIQSVVTEINEGETKISQTVIQVGDKTLEIVMSEQFQKITDTEEKISNIESKKMLHVDVIPEGGSLYEDGKISCTFRAVVYSWDDDITDLVPKENFTWRRESADKEYDAYWNENHKNYHEKELVINADDVITNDYKVITDVYFVCDVSMET